MLIGATSSAALLVGLSGQKELFMSVITLCQARGVGGACLCPLSHANLERYSPGLGENPPPSPGRGPAHPSLGRSKSSRRKPCCVPCPVQGTPRLSAHRLSTSSLVSPLPSLQGGHAGLETNPVSAHPLKGGSCECVCSCLCVFMPLLMPRLLWFHAWSKVLVLVLWA